MGKEFLTIYWRDMLRFIRFRALLISSLVQPALWMAFFGVTISSSFSRISPGAMAPTGVYSVDYLTFMAAGVIAMTTLFTSLFGGITLLFDKNWGLMREILASPMPRKHILAGIGLSCVTKSFIQVLIIIVFGLILGVSFFHGYGPVMTALSVLGILLFVGIFSLGFLFLSATISMRMETPEGVNGVITLLSMPLFFVSNALYPVDAFPPVLQYASQFNPLNPLITGVRYFAIGPEYYAFGSYYVQTVGDLLSAFMALLIFAILMFAIAWRTFQKAVVTA